MRVVDDNDDKAHKDKKLQEKREHKSNRDDSSEKRVKSKMSKNLKCPKNVILLLVDPFLRFTLKKEKDTLIYSSINTLVSFKSGKPGKS